MTMTSRSGRDIETPASPHPDKKPKQAARTANRITPLACDMGRFLWAAAAASFGTKLSTDNHFVIRRSAILLEGHLGGC
jgi:hypothetical protein